MLSTINFFNNHRGLSRIIVIGLASVIVALSFNLFLIPHKILSGGVSGIAMIIANVSPLKNTGLFIFLLNIPILIAGYLKLGKRFVGLSILSVAMTSVAMQLIPEKQITSEPLLAAVFGGAITGLAVGLIFRFGGSTAGFDIIGLLLTQKRDFPLGILIFSLNSIVVLTSGFIFGWDLALYTMVSIYTTGRVIDTVHTRHIKLTLMIISAQGEKIKEKLLTELERGITVLDGEGAYTGEKRKILFVVISRYELSEVKTFIQSIDPDTFVNITQTIGVMGSFRKT
ncbi:uncharacterized membrane-anchored protein YitT (DUF2179 family) [Ammoniphilus resinae]|uniref:Uncharacterized membrane-anchored protein YitT (DUF2179 family) n=1 Tax=Ammoniphilus resinae TaxID=861532 RepID=A0ABS4GTY2_9BACL|nr:uncharacterized membrane-anchored protein YitT (DUF2179 family) [Ammoniphilus resinae]